MVAGIFSGSTPLYQWQVSTDNGASYSVISGATSSSYTIASVSTNQNNERYRVVVSASGGTSLISSAATLIVYSQTAIEYLVVGGGGGGGMDMGGGGGGGAVLTGAMEITAGQSYTISIGQGGWGAPAAGTNRGDGAGPQPGSHQYTIPATNGGTTSALGMTAIGGGAGGSSYWGHQLAGYGANGASGGGSSGYKEGVGNPDRAGLGTVGLGYRGGQSANDYYSGGGGGAGGPGVDAPNRPDGGPGLASAILGTNYYWGGGGGGASYSLDTGGYGGLGGGGGGALGIAPGGAGLNAGAAGGGGSPGSWANRPGGSGGANTGGGGGGGSHYNSNNAGGNGGSGVVILVSAVPLASVSAGLTYTVDTTSRPGLFVYLFTAGSGTVSR